MIDVYHKLIEMAQKPGLTPDEQFALGYAAGKIEPAGGWVKTLKVNPEAKEFEHVYPCAYKEIEMTFRYENEDGSFYWETFDGHYHNKAFFRDDDRFQLTREPDYWRYMIYPEAPE